MYDRSLRRYFVIFALVFLVLIIGVILLFGGGDDKPKTTPGTTVKVKPLPDYANTDVAVSLTIDGKVNGEDVHRAIRVTVDRYQRKLDIIKGYSGNIETTHSLTNTRDAYDVFLRSLRTGGFLAKNENVKLTDSRGQCPLGLRYIYELDDAGDSLSNLWSTSCGTKQGNFAGNPSLVQSLFKAQITDYSKLTSKVIL